MKRIIILLLTICLTQVSCVFSTNKIKGNGKIVSQELKLEPFNKVNISSFADVRIHKAEEFKAIVKTDSNLHQYVELKVENNTLEVGICNTNASCNFTTLVIDIYTNAIEDISISGSGDVLFKDNFTSPYLNIYISGSGGVKGLIETDKFNAELKGSGGIEFKGKAKEVHFESSGSGDIHCYKLEADTAYANVAGSGDIKLWAKSFLNATISGSGNVRYKGTPQIQMDVTGSGNVRNAH
ncbi:MAG: DUF2807 domain-containing protein [Bacteroidales bacterium]|jgi:hypothetical protein|nr:DUF2807 domain-containing protein [Bacteroidales bacterium]